MEHFITAKHCSPDEWLGPDVYIPFSGNYSVRKFIFVILLGDFSEIFQMDCKDFKQSRPVDFGYK